MITIAESCLSAVKSEATAERATDSPSVSCAYFTTSLSTCSHIESHADFVITTATTKRHCSLEASPVDTCQIRASIITDLPVLLGATIFLLKATE